LRPAARKSATTMRTSTDAIRWTCMPRKIARSAPAVPKKPM
jgi:hypothetical protein